MIQPPRSPVTMCHRDVVDLAEGVRNGQWSAEEIVVAYLDRAATSELNAYLQVDGEHALSRARAVDAKRARGEKLGSLAGVPVAIKDNICTRGMVTTCASRILEGYVPPYDADVVEALTNADAVLLGKTNMDEFAMGSSNEHSAFGPVLNPWDVARVPGGSSGGSAAATAAGLAGAAIGSDTGGSVRQPAAFCGVTALKPTYGRVSRYGLVAFASSLDQIGPFGRSVRDTARLFEVMAGCSKRDATSVEAPIDDYEEACHRRSGNLTVGIVDDQGSAIEPSIRETLEHLVHQLEQSGVRFERVQLPHIDHAISVYYLIATAEASSNLARFDGVRYGLSVEGSSLESSYAQTRAQGFGPEVKRRIMLGTYALSAGYYDDFYVKAQRVRTLITRDYAAAFKKCDVIMQPTTPTTAFALGAKTTDPLEMYRSDMFTLPASLAGLPAVSTPCGFCSDGLPIGVQYTAPAFQECRLFEIAQRVADLTSLDLIPQHH